MWKNPPKYPILNRAKLPKSPNSGECDQVKITPIFNTNLCTSSYVDTDGNSRWETVEYQIVKDGDKEVVVPLATGGHEYTHGGIKIVQTYTSGVKGTSFSTVWDGKPKKGQ